MAFEKRNVISVCSTKLLTQISFPLLPIESEPSANKIMTAGNNNLHGTLRSLSKKYCSKAGHKRGPRGVIPAYRNSLKPRNDKLQVVSIVPVSGNDAAQAPTPKGPLAPETKVNVETTAAKAVTATTNSATATTPAKEQNTATKTTTTTILLRSKDLEEYEKAENVQQEALKKIERAREKVYKDQIQKVWGVYLYGLKHVLALNDLSNSPDSILPGNF